MNLEPISLSEASQNEKDKYTIIPLICGTQEDSAVEIESQMQKSHLWLQGERGGRDVLGDWDWHIYPGVYELGN